MNPGRDEELEALCTHATAVLAYLQLRAPSEADALTLFRHTMLRAWSRIDRLPVGDAKAQLIWLLAVAAEALARSAYGSCREYSATTNFDEVRPPDRWQARADAPATLREALPRLATDQRELVMLIHWDRLTVAEAAQIVGIETTAAIALYGAARANLRAALEGARI